MREFTQIPSSQWNEMRSFCAHELAARLDSLGGLCDLSYIDAAELDGRCYPDEIPLPIMNRDLAEYVGRPVYGPAIQLYTRTKRGRDILHHPATHTVAPWSLYGTDEVQTFHFFMERHRIFWRIECMENDANDLCWCLQPATLFCGEKDVHIQQHTGVSSTQSGGLYTEDELAEHKPTLNGTAQVQWQQEGFDEREQTLYIRGTVEYPSGTKNFYLAVGSNAPVVCREHTGITVLCAPWAGRQEITLVLALGNTREEAFALMRDGTQNHQQILENNIRAAEAVEADAPVIQIPRLKAAAAFGQMASQYLDAMTVGETDSGDLGVRAAVYKYGYYSLWDSIYPVRDLLWNGRLEDAKRQITYLLTVPMMENTPIAGLHAIVQLNEVLAFCPRWDTKPLYPSMLKIFRLAARSTEPVYNMLVYSANVGVDITKELGVDGQFLSPEVNAMWYMACRVMKNEALRHEDRETYEKADEIARGIESGYRKVFFDEKDGYLRAAVRPDLTVPETSIYQNTNTWGYDYPFGMYLMRDLVKPLANYQATRLYHPEGHRAVAMDSFIPCEMWKQVHMNQHNGHEMKLQRMAGNMDEVYRVMSRYLERFDRWQSAEETTNFSRFAIHPSQVCDWQAFSATANMEALRSAVAGILRHRGGISYLPAADRDDMQIHNIPVDDKRVSVCVVGDGEYGVLTADDKEISGTLQVPADISYKTLTVRRSDKLPAYPVLLTALDMPVEKLMAEENCLQFTCAETVSTPVCLLCEKTPIVFVNDVKRSPEYHCDSKKAWIDYCWHKGDVVTVQM